MNYVWYNDTGIKSASTIVGMPERLKKLSTLYSVSSALIEEVNDHAKSQTVMEEVLDNCEYSPKNGSYVEFKFHTFYVAELEFRLKIVLAP